MSNNNHEVIIPPENGPFKINIGYGNRRKEDFINIDTIKTEQTDHVFDVAQPNWPIEDNVVDMIYCEYFFQRLDGLERITFLNECYRILKNNTQIMIIVPYWATSRAVMDPLCKWPPIAGESFQFYRKKWREENNFAHYPIECDFEFTCGMTLDPEVALKNREVQEFQGKYYINTLLDLHVTLMKVTRKET